MYGRIEECWVAVQTFWYNDGTMDTNLLTWRFYSGAEAARYLREFMGFVSFPRYRSTGSKNIYTRIHNFGKSNEYLEVVEVHKTLLPHGSWNADDYSEDLDFIDKCDLTASQMRDYIAEKYPQVLKVWGV